MDDSCRFLIQAVSREDSYVFLDEMIQLGIPEADIWEDEQEKMNLSVADVGGGLLVVSQFTLYGDCRKGKRPSFDKAAGAEMANAYYEKFVAGARAKGLSVGTGKFQAHMLVSLVNNGPVTILLDSKKNF